MKISPGKLWGLRRLADARGHWRIVATDQRELLAEPVAKARGVDVAPYEDVAGIVTRLVAGVQPEVSALLLDPIYGYLPAIEHVEPSTGLLLSYESLSMDSSPGGVKTEPIPGWSVEKIRCLGADAVKVLVLYRADADPAIRAHQEAFVERAGEECARFDIPMLLEVLVYPLAGETPEELAAERATLVPAAVAPFRDPRFRVDLYKLEPPCPLEAVPARGTPAGERLHEAYRELTDGLPRPWVLLSAGMGKDDFRASLGYAYACGASGYLAGRAIWSQAPPHFPDLDALSASVRDESLPYLRELNELTRRAATPWFEHPSIGGAVQSPYEPDRDFPARYATAA